VAALVAQPAGRGDVPGHVLAAVLLGYQVFGGATKRVGRSGGQTEGFQFIG